ncbi:MAG: hypothetical protein ACJ71N_01235 [Terriglobales bacterium]|jgi:hypothetical protein
MVTFHPIFVLLAVIVLLIGATIHFVRKSSTFRGYSDVAQDAQRLQSALKGETFRDGADLVVSGSKDKFPAMVRFSYDENTPGLNIRMSAPANFTLTISPKGAQASGEGRTLVRTGDDMFDARFTTKTDHMAQAKMFVGGKQALMLMQKLCCSSKTFLAISNGSIELSELVIPTPSTSAHVMDHVQNMSKLALQLQAMPGAETVKVRAYEREGSSIVGKVAVATVLLAGLAIFVAQARKPDQTIAELKAQAGTNALPEGVLPLDATKLGSLNGWRLVTPEDFDPDVAAWVRGQGLKVQGRVAGDYSGQSNPRDVIYLFTNEAGTMRVSVISGDKVVYDTKYPKLVVASKFSKYNWNSTQWKAAPVNPAGDGLLVVTKKDDPGLVLYWDGHRIGTAVPQDYQRMNLQ